MAIGIVASLCAAVAYQINAVVPSGIVTGDTVPLVISVAGQTSPISPAVTMAVK